MASHQNVDSINFQLGMSKLRVGHVRSKINNCVLLYILLGIRIIAKIIVDRGHESELNKDSTYKSHAKALNSELVFFPYVSTQTFKY